MKRQKIRKGLLIISLLLFPITIWYFSPYMIIQGALEHVISGSAVVFIILAIVSMFFGRVFCGYICPMGGLQECAMLVNDKTRKRDWRYSIKYIIWIVWIAGVLVSYFFGKGNYQINVFYMTDHGISVSNIYSYITYYAILILFLIPSICFGKRFACLYFCWIAPFMVIGEKIGRTLHLPQLHIRVNDNQCISCNKCSKSCPMSINVMEKVEFGEINDAECIQCGTCVDVCPKHVLSYDMTKVAKKKNGK